MVLLLAISRVGWAAHPIVESDVEYAVTYEVNFFETETVRPVKLVDVVTLGSKQFLVVEVRGFNKTASAFIDLEHIRVILPLKLEGFSIERTRHPKDLPLVQPERR
jgi:hypothetical protein